MEQSHAPRTERMDLLGDDGEAGGNTERSPAAIAGRATGRETPAVLLDRMHSPDGQEDQPVGAMGSEQTKQEIMQTTISQRLVSAGEMSEFNE